MLYWRYTRTMSWTGRSRFGWLMNRCRRSSVTGPTVPRGPMFRVAASINTRSLSESDSAAARAKAMSHKCPCFRHERRCVQVFRTRRCSAITDKPRIYKIGAKVSSVSCMSVSRMAWTDFDQMRNIIRPEITPF